MNLMRALLHILAPSVLLLSACSVLRAGDTQLPSFLQPGNDYVLRFADKSPFEQTEGLLIEPQKGKAANTINISSARVTYSITVFTVVELSGGSWVSVEHPKSIKEASKWNFKRFAMAALNPETIAKLEATDDGKVRLAQLREQASVEISTERTWVNLDHVVAITKPPTEPLEFKLNLTVNKPE